jgi:predicted TIM-barrel fold metal-dependent hydrolase
MSAVSELVSRVEGCWQDVRRELEGLDLSTAVYTDPLWTARDVLVHCAFWNDEATAALEAFRRGEAHVTDTGTPTFDEGLDALNDRVVAGARSLSDDEARERWVAAQDRLTDAVRALDAEALQRAMTTPWGERMSVEEMMLDELGHETGHVDDIITAVSAQEEG